MKSEEITGRLLTFPPIFAEKILTKQSKYHDTD